MINGKNFEHRPIEELMAIVKSSFRKLDAEGLVDDANFIKHVMWCNEKLGLSIREVREIAIPVDNYKAELPLDFEKLHFVCALECSNTTITNFRDPFDNSFDADVIYDAKVSRGQPGCVDCYDVTIERKGTQVTYNYNTWTPLQVSMSSAKHCHASCPNVKKPGKYIVDIKDDGTIETPFRTGTLYLMYLGMMKDEQGNITFPFHPMITPFYEYAIKERILEDAIMNSDMTNLGQAYEIAQRQRGLAWIDAFNATMEESYNEFVKRQRKKELGWYNQYFKFLQ